MGCCYDPRDPAAATAGTTPARWRKGCILCRIWHILRHGGKSPHGDPCVVIPGHIAHKPDPCIYSQFLLMKLDQPVTWDNPDIRILLGGIEQYSYNLVAATDYQLEVTVHNASRDKPALGTSVAIRWVEFGAGGQIRHPIATVMADVPTWPGTAIVAAPWRTPDLPGHYCIEVELAHGDDGNPSNNVGWNNTQVHAAHSPVTRPIRVFNRYPGDCPPVREGGGPWLRPHRVLAGWGVLGAAAALILMPWMHERLPLLAGLLALLLAGYALGALSGLAAETAYAAVARQRRAQRGRDPRTDRIDCHLVELAVDSYTFEDRVGKEFDPKTAFQGKPPAWPAVIDPPSFVFQPGEAFRDVELRVDVPDERGGPAQFNVNVRQGGVPSGGVTITLTREA